MSSIYDMIKTLWIEAGSDIEKPPHLMNKEMEARQLDEQLSERFKEPLMQFNEGLISSTELLDKLYWEASKVADEG